MRGIWGSYPVCMRITRLDSLGIQYGSQGGDKGLGFRI